MDFVSVDTAVVVLMSVWVVAVSLYLLVRIVCGGYRTRFFAGWRGSACDGYARQGVSVLCRDMGGVERLHNLLSVEYPDYEVVVVADSLRNPDSLRRVVEEYRLVVVDVRPSDEGIGVRVRKMYRSASRCYRRLLLLDVDTSGERADLDAAFEVATYDYLLPLWGAELLVSGAVERLMAEVGTLHTRDFAAVGTCVGEPLLLIARRAIGRTEGVDAAVRRLRHRYIIYEALAYLPHRSLWAKVVVMGVMMVVVVCSVAVMAGVVSLEMGVVALSLLIIIVASYAATITISHNTQNSVEYGAVLSLFCKNILPRIWQIRK